MAFRTPVFTPHNMNELKRSERHQRATDKHAGNIDQRLSELHDRLVSDRFKVKIKESDRLQNKSGLNPISYVSSGHQEVDAEIMSAYTSVRYNMIEIIDLNLKGYDYHFAEISKFAEGYQLVLDYLQAWVDRSNYYPDYDMPPMSDFLNIDDFLSNHYPNYDLVCFINNKSTTAPAKPRGLLDQFSPVFSLEEAHIAAIRSGYKPKAYNSLISKFHSSSWSRR